MVHLKHFVIHNWFNTVKYCKTYLFKCYYFIYIFMDELVSDCIKIFNDENEFH